MGQAAFPAKEQAGQFPTANGTHGALSLRRNRLAISLQKSQVQIQNPAALGYPGFAEGDKPPPYGLGRHSSNPTPSSVATRIKVVKAERAVHVPCEGTGRPVPYKKAGFKFGTRPTISLQLSPINYHLSAISYQLSPIGCDLLKRNDQLVMRLTAVVNFKLDIRVFFANSIRQQVRLGLVEILAIEERDAFHLVHIGVLQ